MSLPNGTFFVSRYERNSRKIYRAISVCLELEHLVRKINDRQTQNKRSEVCFCKYIKTGQGQKNQNDIYRKLSGINQTGSGLVSTLAILGIQIGAKAISSVLGKNTKTLKTYQT